MKQTQTKTQTAVDLSPVDPSIPVPTPKPSDYLGTKCIVRTYNAGVFFGIVRFLEGETCIVENVRQLWHWKAVRGIQLTSVAKHGIVPSESKISEFHEEVLVTNCIQLVKCSPAAIFTIESAPNA